MITIRHILAIPDDEEPGFIPNQRVQIDDSSSESEAEHESATLGKDVSLSKIQALAAEETILKSSEIKEDGQYKEIKETKDAPPKLENGGQATVDELVEIELGEEGDHKPTFISALLSQ